MIRTPRANPNPHYRRVEYSETKENLLILGVTLGSVAAISAWWRSVQQNDLRRMEREAFEFEKKASALKAKTAREYTREYVPAARKYV
jgi:hypothetical protein